MLNLREYILGFTNHGNSSVLTLGEVGRISDEIFGPPVRAEDSVFIPPPEKEEGKISLLHSTARSTGRASVDSRLEKGRFMTEDEYQEKVISAFQRQSSGKVFAGELLDTVRGELIHTTKFKNFISNYVAQILRETSIDSDEGRIEIEFSLVDMEFQFDKNNLTFKEKFVPRVSRTGYSNILEAMKFMEIEGEKRTTTNTTFKTYRKVVTSVGNEIFEQKTRILVNDSLAKNFGIRLNISSEKEIPPPPPPTVGGGEDVTNIRKKKSHVFTIGNWELEVSEVEETFQGKSRKKQTFRGYGVELEFLGEKISDEDIQVCEAVIGLLCVCKNSGFIPGSIRDIFRPVKIPFDTRDYENVVKILLSFYTTKGIPLEIERGYIAFKFNNLIYFRSKDFSLCKRRGEFLIPGWNTHMRNIQESDMLDQNSSYKPTLKLDGVRALLMTTDLGTYIISPPNGIFKISSSSIFQKGVGVSILDGEIYYSKQGIFDFKISEFSKLAVVPSYLETSVNTLRDFSGAETKYASMSGGSVAPKKKIKSFKLKKRGGTITQTASASNRESEIIVNGVNGSGFYAFDILVYNGETLVHTPFSRKRSRKGRTRLEVLLTFVMEAQTNLEQSQQLKNFSIHPSKPGMIGSSTTLNLFAKKFYSSRKDALDAHEILITVSNEVGSSTSSSKKWLLDGLVLQNEKKYYDQSLKWKPPEHMTIDFGVGAVVRGLGNAFLAKVSNGSTFSKNGKTGVITVGTDYEKRLLPDEVHECKFVSENDEFIVFKAVRYRYDKPKPNAKRTAENVYRDIQNPLQQSTLLNADNTLSRRYQNLLKFVLLKRSMTFIYGSWEDVFLAIRGDSDEEIPDVNIVDIGSGRGGDLGKWKKIEGYLNNITAFEPFEDNYNEFQNRLQNTSSRLRDKITVVNAPFETSPLETTNPENGVTLITSFYSLTFFFKSRDTMENLFKRIDKYSVGSLFCTAFMDGDIYYRQVSSRDINDPRIDCSNEINSRTNFSIRYKSYSKHDSKYEFGREVQVAYEGSQSFIPNASTSSPDAGTNALVYQSEFASSYKAFVQMAAEFDWAVVYTTTLSPDSPFTEDDYGFMGEEEQAELNTKFGMLNNCGKKWASYTRIVTLIKIGETRGFDNIPKLFERSGNNAYIQKTLRFSERLSRSLSRSLPTTKLLLSPDIEDDVFDDEIIDLGDNIEIVEDDIDLGMFGGFSSDDEDSSVTVLRFTRDEDLDEWVLDEQHNSEVFSILEKATRATSAFGSTGSSSRTLQDIADDIDASEIVLDLLSNEVLRFEDMEQRTLNRDEIEDFALIVRSRNDVESPVLIEAPQLGVLISMYLSIEQIVKTIPLNKKENEFRNILARYVFGVRDGMSGAREKAFEEAEKVGISTQIARAIQVFEAGEDEDIEVSNVKVLEYNGEGIISYFIDEERKTLRFKMRKDLSLSGAQSGGDNGVVELAKVYLFYITFTDSTQRWSTSEEFITKIHKNSRISRGNFYVCFADMWNIPPLAAENGLFGYNSLFETEPMSRGPWTGVESMMNMLSDYESIGLSEPLTFYLNPPFSEHLLARAASESIQFAELVSEQSLPFEVNIVVVGPNWENSEFQAVMSTATSAFSKRIYKGGKITNKTTHVYHETFIGGSGEEVMKLSPKGFETVVYTFSTSRM